MSGLIRGCESGTLIGGNSPHTHDPELSMENHEQHTANSTAENAGAIRPSPMENVTGGIGDLWLLGAKGAKGINYTGKRALACQLMALSKATRKVLSARRAPDRPEIETVDVVVYMLSYMV